MAVTAIIVNFNTSKDVLTCVDSLFAAGVQDVVVVDNHSNDTDQQLEAIQRSGSMVRVYRLPANVGFGAGINRGFALAGDLKSEDYIWIVNPDLRVSEESAMELQAALNSGWDIVSPVIFTGNKDAPRVWYAGGYMNVRKGLSQPLADLPRNFGPVPVSFITGAAPMLKVETWEDLGGFREDLFMYWEDADLSLRAKDRGLKLAVVPAATAWHDVGGSQGGGSGKSKLYYYYMSRNRLVVCGERHSRFRIAFVDGVRISLRLLAASLREKESKLSKASAVLVGMLAGFLA
ncbi:glycosyltransferase family 2 protein [Georgenia sp. EYE_87]|uniref:glycosyltransferase family 2 protein n=1 Tax=Georgenia sp. EYE_87 TaxID=2853448 RepID=UPI002003F07B|nr:glycosyltransferase family 2 protein [Georgenia sp. EYE_87]MCK6210813.1 glycosyltransferase family 2 protein [Georgenia sp. EYE_87]